MPLYEYECKQCKLHTEKIQKFSDPEITQCPHCGGPLERVVTAPAIAFKGGGWFKDGYGSAKPSSSNSETKSDTGTSSASTTEAPASSSSKDSPSAPAGGSTSPAATPTTSSESSSEKK